MSNDLILYGASNPCPLKILGALERAGQPWNILGFLDDEMSTRGCVDSFGYPILGGRDTVSTFDLSTVSFVNNIFGSMKSRRLVGEMLIAQGCRLIGLLSPGTDLHLVRLGEAVTIEQQVAIDAFTQIGDHCCLKRTSSIGHETTLGDYVFVGPGATVCGRVTLGDGVYVGAGSVVRDAVRIGEGTIIGAGAVVTKDLPAGVVVMGNPAVIRPTTPRS